MRDYFNWSSRRFRNFIICRNLSVVRFFWHCTQFGTLYGPSAKMFLLFTRPTSLIWSFFPLKLRYPALYSIYSSGALFIAACNHNYTLFLFNSAAS